MCVSPDGDGCSQSSEIRGPRALRNPGRCIGGEHVSKLRSRMTRLDHIAAQRSGIGLALASAAGIGEARSPQRGGRLTVACAYQSAILLTPRVRMMQAIHCRAELHSAVN